MEIGWSFWACRLRPNWESMDDGTFVHESEGYSLPPMVRLCSVLPGERSAGAVRRLAMSRWPTSSGVGPFRIRSSNERANGKLQSELSSSQGGIGASKPHHVYVPLSRWTVL
jgi:hypothetical protein